MSPSDPLTPAEILPGAFKASILERAQREREAMARELVDPEFRAQRERQREERRLAAFHAHEQAQRDAVRPYLIACGVAEREADVLVQGLNDNAQRWPAVGRVRRFWKSKDCLLLLTGASGTGKTVAACEPILDCRFSYQHPDFGTTWAFAATPQHRGRYVLAPTLAVAEKFGTAAERQMAGLLAVRYLVIDELGEELKTDAWRSVLERIIGERHRAKKKTVLITNLDAAQFAAHYGEAGGGEGRIQRRIRTDGAVFDAGQRRIFQKGDKE